MKAKKLLISLSALTLTLLLVAGCGNGEKATGGTSSSESKTAESSTTDSKETVDLNSLDLPQLSKEVADNEALVELVTSEGNIQIKLFPEQAPKAVENFIQHAKDGYYDGVKFHRIIEGFMIQSGDPEGTGAGGESIWGEEFVPEISNQLYHINGALAMARTGLPVDQPSQGSQFYIVQNHDNMADGLLKEDYPDKIIEAYQAGGAPNLDFQYSVFGQVIEGLDVVDKIAATEVKAGDSGEKSTPTKDITIKEVKVLQEAK
ncbi:peptidylprolyl isomerase [Vagococcus sp. BWB3-3]|uniref:Peptidyl-prolyl cis-trans isomerase n=1 Tax=Vagococcus allomyrinae TaxID=2794353 RepID=A0A940SSC4_9ENTE|nr:peptidylprolyl isomerase [Vagococcus allomyrinae]MBP1041772.1 peptidylprolyl isomerase [Vagococcus allomyrinae]